MSSSTAAATARRSIQALNGVSSPLLKFHDEKAVLSPEGLDRIRKLKGLIYPVIFVGDGRAGKSYLASRLLGLEKFKEVFVVSNSAESVTEGIDMVVWPMSRLVDEKETDAEPGTWHPGCGEELYMLILDCEGGNNAMAAIRTLVNVFGIVIGMEVVFVCGSAFSEAALHNLAASLAARSLIRLDASSSESQLPEQRLLFLVNKNTLKYDADTLERALHQDQSDPGRRENRQTVLAAFPQRRFISIPLLGTPGAEDSIAAFRKKVIQDRRPLSMGGMPVRAQQLCSLLEVIVAEMHRMKEVSFPSMSRCVIYDGFLKPMITKLLAEAEAGLPKLVDYDPDLPSKDPRDTLLAQFDKSTAHVSDAKLVQEAREELEEELNSLWRRVSAANNAFGEQAQEIGSESREILGEKKKCPIGGCGLLTKVVLSRREVHVETRSVIQKKNGNAAYGDWMQIGTRTDVEETAFSDLNALPMLHDRLLKRSPSLLKTILTFGMGDYQEYECIIREGHIIWWGSAAPGYFDDDTSGVVNLFLNRAEVAACESDKNRFVVRPRDPEGWSDVSGIPSGDPFRCFTFSADGSGTARDDWVDAITEHIQFADLAYEQLGKVRVVAEIGKGDEILVKDCMPGNEMADLGMLGDQSFVEGTGKRALLAPDGRLMVKQTLCGCCGMRGSPPFPPAHARPQPPG